MYIVYISIYLLYLSHATVIYLLYCTHTTNLRERGRKRKEKTRKGKKKSRN